MDMKHVNKLDCACSDCNAARLQEQVRANSDKSYRVVVVVEELTAHEHKSAIIAEWEVSGIRFGSCSDAVTHGQRVRKAAEKITPQVLAS